MVAMVRIQIAAPFIIRVAHKTEYEEIPLKYQNVYRAGCAAEYVASTRFDRLRY